LDACHLMIHEWWIFPSILWLGGFHVRFRPGARCWPRRFWLHSRGSWHQPMRRKWWFVYGDLSINMQNCLVCRIAISITLDYPLNMGIWQGTHHHDICGLLMFIFVMIEYEYENPHQPTSRGWQRVSNTARTCAMDKSLIVYKPMLGDNHQPIRVCMPMMFGFPLWDGWPQTIYHVLSHTWVCLVSWSSLLQWP